MSKTPMTQFILACLCCYGISQTTLAAPAQPASVQELIRLSNAEQLVKEAVKSYTPYFQKHSEQVIKEYTGHETLTEQDQVAVQKLSKIFLNTVETFLQQAKPIEIIKNIYTQQLSEEEVQAYIRFLKSPEGQSINQKMPIILQQTAQKINQATENLTQDKKFQQQITQQIANVLKPLPKKASVK
ncbi:DUF2059 domain-containing protein [Acinetobacter sp. ANC 4641]|uniref:DUF2059 domain-containing protein n=1 Tax=Acinetobacter sp. ANC 4641 TaxID=2529847 RepID=UPI00103BDC47|nr:DUF2059 domain-containing protein [Acinetobacter sp. ANC 4641]TCB07488.1 DUF2059 domain-containing protein [Acinetobacter sp. ANC 4641]